MKFRISGGVRAADWRERFWKCAVFFLLAAYLGMFAYLNLAKYAQHVDSDIAAEALLAREIWTEKTFTPDSWMPSTELHIFNMPLVAALFYGATGSMALGAGMACAVLGALFTGVLYWFFRRIGLSQTACLTAILALCAVPINGLRNEGQMVPFLTLLLFLFADYYVLHSILLFLAIAFYLHLREGKPRGGRADVAGGIFLFCFAFALCLEGQRCLQVVILPLMFVEAISLFAESGLFSRRLSRERSYAAGYVGAMLSAYLLSNFYGGRVDYPMYLLPPQDAMAKIFTAVPAAILEGFGLAGNVRVGTFASLMQMLVWAFLALVGYGLVFVCERKGEIGRGQRETVAILSSSLGITVFVVAFTSVEPAQNYFFLSWFIAVLVVGILVDCFRKKKSWFADLIILAVCAFALLNIRYTYSEAISSADHLREYEEVADFLIEEGVSYGYAEFWDAGRISLVRDGAVTFGCSYTMENLGAYWWLTSTKWYPPALPEQMRTAYVVRIQKKEAFEGQFEGEDAPALCYENEKFAVYIGDRNYVAMN